MAKGKRTVRASEISAFVYCQRAWWYQRQNKQPLNTEELADGTGYHQEHARLTRWLGKIQIAAWLVVLLSLVFLAVYFSLQFFG